VKGERPTFRGGGGRSGRARGGPLRRALRAAATGVYALACVPMAAAALAPHLGWAGWRIDMLAQFSAHAALATLAALTWWVLRRRWRFAAAALVCLVLHGIVLVPGRAPWATQRDAASASLGPVRVLQFNAYALNRSAEEALHLLLTSDADIVAVTEPSYPLLKRGWRDEALRGAYPYFDQNPRGWYMGWQYVLSKWPLREFEERDNGGNPSVVISLVAQRPPPWGDLGVVMIHPQSPRNAGRWLQGNELVDEAAAVVRRMREAGLPVVLLADLNSTPAGVRNQRLVRRTDLKRCKPLLRAEGTWPSDRRWPERIAIDDAWVSPGFLVRSWEVVGPAGSDHMGVVVDLLAPAGPASAVAGEEGEGEAGDPYRDFGLP
jgi:endonuclease/exonuclease/phosphatase (EEP) superfamily protein YafD